uniref:Uncharacterized protein n=1 Tax=Physcomitrium patens TaxID=3218 RepID=A0A7I3YY91_PHYPA
MVECIQARIEIRRHTTLPNNGHFGRCMVYNVMILSCLSILRSLLSLHPPRTAVLPSFSCICQGSSLVYGQTLLVLQRIGNLQKLWNDMTLPNRIPVSVKNLGHVKKT